MSFPGPWSAGAPPCRRYRHWLGFCRVAFVCSGDQNQRPFPERSNHDLIKLADHGADDGAQFVIDHRRAFREICRLLPPVLPYRGLG
jgi:hypothetical protein